MNDEDQEEEPFEVENVSEEEEALKTPTPSPEQASSPAPVPASPASVKVINLDDDDEMDAVQGGGQPPSPPQDASGGGVPPPVMGWIVRIYHKLECNTASHHRLVGVLINYYADWNAVVEYVCFKYTHPLEDTYWKTRVSIFSRDEELEAYKLEALYKHHGRRATMEDSMDDAAFEALLDLCGTALST